MSSTTSIQTSIQIAAAFAVLIWGLKLCALAFGWDLYQLGVYPRTVPRLRHGDGRPAGGR